MVLLRTGVITVFLVYLHQLPNTSHAKYVRGHLKTLEVSCATLAVSISTFHPPTNSSSRKTFLQDWAFLARFCFVSGKGRYEYEIEFDRRYGEPQLLLYYDDKSQWPSVYKSDKVSESGAVFFADNGSHTF